MEGPGICVLCLADTCASEVHPVFNPVAPYGYLLSNMYLFIADITNPDDRLGQKTVNRAPIARAEGFDTICTAVGDCCNSSTACRLCRLEPKITGSSIL